MHMVFKRKSRRLGLGRLAIYRYNRLSRILLIFSIIKSITMRSILIPCVPIPRPIDKDGRGICINTYRGDDVDFISDFHYTKFELHRIVHVYNFPNT